MSIGQFFLHSERWLYSGTGIGTGLSGSSGGILWELDSVRWVAGSSFPSRPRHRRCKVMALPTASQADPHSTWFQRGPFLDAQIAHQ